MPKRKTKLYDLGTIMRLDAILQESIGDSEGKPIADIGEKQIAILYDRTVRSTASVKEIIKSGDFDAAAEDTSLLILDKRDADKLFLMLKPHLIKPDPETKEKAPKITRDAEYDRIVEKFFKPFNMLSKYWARDEILNACAEENISRSAICEEMKIISEYSGEGRCPYPDAEYLRTGIEDVREYDRNGREYLNSGRRRCNVYRVRNKYQGLQHGKVILRLLYGRYPQLRKFGFQAYEYDDCENRNRIPYEIYPYALSFYVPFEAMLAGDADAIIKRNEDYCRSYNAGEYTLKKHAERLENDEKVKALLETIRSLPETND